MTAGTPRAASDLVPRHGELVLHVGVARIGGCGSFGPLEDRGVGGPRPRDVAAVGRGGADRVAHVNDSLRRLGPAMVAASCSARSSPAKTASNPLAHPERDPLGCPGRDP
ncbi:hypothetical protein [Nannocystis exedens]|uniref:hypothetical protein n=1 Tax=Nannocystis exedens TaxID=54 RepID=UPI000BB9FE89|nr:hypothetical protein [Nannocystis exedens]